MPWRRMESGGIAPTFLTSELDGGEWSVSRSGRFTPGMIVLCTQWIGGWMGLGAPVWTLWSWERSLASASNRSIQWRMIYNYLSWKYRKWSESSIIWGIIAVLEGLRKQWKSYKIKWPSVWDISRVHDSCSRFIEGDMKKLRLKINCMLFCYNIMFRLCTQVALLPHEEGGWPSCGLWCTRCSLVNMNTKWPHR
jgi:hypothetical protein